MIFGRRARNHHAIAIVRDIVEIVAIVAAGAWAFYVFVYENRIKPSFAQPEVNMTATIDRLGERNGLIAVGLHLTLRNVGTVPAHFLALAVNVYGQRVMAAENRPPAPSKGLYEYFGFYRLGRPVPVYTWAYLTSLGDPASKHDMGVDPGTTIENDRTFYVPAGRFDLLSVGIDAPYIKYEHVHLAKLAIQPAGDVKVATALTSEVQRYDVWPVSTLDVR